MSYLKFYEECMKTGELIPEPGLCNCFSNCIDSESDFELMIPDKPYGYWAYGERFSSNFQQFFSFTPLRQNIVLFLAAMNNEL